LERPAAFLPRLLATPLFWPAAPAANIAVTETTTVATGSLTNGPFLLAEQTPGDHITLTKNPTYWNAAEVSIERIEFPIVPDLGRQLALFEQGDLQAAGLPAEETARVQADPGLGAELQVVVQPGVSYLGLNTQKAPTDNPAVRRAIASAINRQVLIEQALKQPWHIPARTLIPPNVTGHQAGGETGYAFDLSAAQRYLQEAGYGPDNPVPPVELWYNREGNNETLFRAVGAMLEQAGIPVRLVSSEWNVYLDALEGCNKPAQPSAARTPAECSYNLYRMGWVMDYPDAASMLAIFRSGSRFQYTGWASAEYTELLNAALAEPDETARGALYGQAEDLLLSEAVIVPIQYYDRTMLVKKGLTFEFPQFGSPHLQTWTLRQ
jgi:oligopeptide transport system substrate-binding protein